MQQSFSWNILQYYFVFSLQVVEVMRFWRREEGQVVAGVRVEGGEDGQAEPEPRGGQVRA
jgi:hypothetical protein